MIHTSCPRATTSGTEKLPEGLAATAVRLGSDLGGLRVLRVRSRIAPLIWPTACSAAVLRHNATAERFAATIPLRRRLGPCLAATLATGDGGTMPSSLSRSLGKKTDEAAQEKEAAVAQASLAVKPTSTKPKEGSTNEKK